METRDMSRGKGIAGAGILLLVLTGLAPVTASAQIIQRPRRAMGSYDRSYQIGFDEGYRKGYEKGQDDARDGRTRNPSDYREYRQADDGYNDRVGSRDDYRMGYRSGFEQGYGDGVYGRQFGARPGQSRVTIPGRGRGGNAPVLGRNKRNGGYPSTVYPGSPYPTGTYGGYPDTYGGGYGRAGQYGKRVGFDQMLVIELETPISTRYSHEGDRFSAVVVEPATHQGARVNGYIGKLEEPGRVAGKGEIILVFESIVWPDGYGEPMQAQVDEVIGYPYGTPRPGNSGVFRRAPWDYGKNDRNDDIDAKAGDEGEIEGKGSKGRDAAVIGGGAAIGAVIGGVVGGGSGAAIGAAVGAASGGGVVATTKGNQIDLEPGAQLRIRTGQTARF
jgi:hypothetical protein